MGDLFHSQRVAERRNLRGAAAATASVVPGRAAPRDRVGFVVRKAGTAPRAAGAGAELNKRGSAGLLAKEALPLGCLGAAAAVSPPLLWGEREQCWVRKKINELDW